MAEIFPFAAHRYAKDKADLAQVLTQPYDKITPQMQERYYALSPFNLIAVEKGRTLPGDTAQNNVYTRAAATLADWIASRVIVPDPAAGIYVYFQEYQVPESSETRTRKGFVALGRIHDYADEVVFRHEQTLSGPKADRLELLRRTRTHTGQLFMLYSDPAHRIDALLNQVSREPAAAEQADEFGVMHRLWPVFDADMIERFRAEMADKKLIIADGHHRYETALAYRNECRAWRPDAGPAAPHEKALMTFFNMHSEGLTVLPTHRLVSGIADFHLSALRQKLEPMFDWYAYPFRGEVQRAASYDEFRKDLRRRARERQTIGAYAGGDAFYLFVLRRSPDLDALLPDVPAAQRQLNVVLLHRLVLEQGLGITFEAVVKEKCVFYEREMSRAIGAVDGGRAQVSFLLNPVRIAQVAEIALAGGVLPQKSTDFYPKLLSGLAMYRLDG